ncbi:Rib/alpha-like domain-containing protein [Enterococcus sp. DIV0421]|uniref:Rib/alpha-like domain-containing protein n=1 Tax=Enterococcus sp. DIV0421 TaxID=2774688 RepID=UPI003F6823F3
MSKKTYWFISICGVMTIACLHGQTIYAQENTNSPLTEETAVLISEGKIRLEDGRVDSLLYKGNILSPDQDDDGDGLLNAEEIYTYFKDGRQYYGYCSHPLVFDTDGDGLSDQEDPQALEWTISTRDMVLFMELTYRDDDYIQKVLDSAQELTELYENRSEYAMMHKELSRFWQVKETYHHDNGFDAVLYETASIYPYLKDHTVQVLGIRGTKGIDDADDDLAIFFGTDPEQANDIVTLINEYSKEPSITNLYVTGHSLGGYLAQRGLIEARKKGYDGYKQSYTFNAPKITGNAFNNWLYELADEGDELTRQGEAVHYIVDNDGTVHMVGTFEGAISVGRSSNGHGSRTYFEELVNDLPGFSVGKRKGMNGTGYEEEVLKRLTFNEIVTDSQVYTEITVQPEKVTVGNPVDLTDNLSHVPKDGKRKDITDYSSIDLTKAGNYTGKVRVTFSDMSEKEFDVPIFVTEKAERVPREIYVRNGGIADLSGDGSKEVPYGSLLYALEQANDGDTIILTEDIALNGTKDLVIEKEVTVDGKNYGIYLRGQNVVLESDAVFKDLGLKFLTDGAIDLEELKIGKIIVNDYTLTMDHVNTLVGKNQNDDRPMLVAGSIDNTKFKGDGAKIKIIHSTSETRFKSIVLGNLSGEKQTVTELEIDGFASSDFGIMASSFDKEPIRNDVTVRLDGGKITQLVQGNQASAVHVTVGKNQSIYGARFDQITDLLLEEGATLTLADDPQNLGKVIVKTGASLNLQDSPETKVTSIETEGTITIDPNQNQLIVTDGITGKGHFRIQAWGGIPDLEKEIIHFPNGELSDIHADIWNPLYELHKQTTGYRLVETPEPSTETKQYTPKLPSEKLEVDNPDNLSQEEEAALIEAVRETNWGYLPDTVDYWIEPQEGLIVLYEDHSEDILLLNQLVTRKKEVPDLPEEPISSGIVIEEIPSIPAENILVEEVYQGDPVTLEDNIQGLPEGSAVEVVEAITSESAGRFEAKVKVTFKNGSSRMVTVPVIVKERISASVLEEIPSIPAENILAEEVYQGDPVALEDNIQGLPEGSAVEVVEAITSESAGRFEAKVKVTFKNGSSRMVTVPVIVKERISASVLEEIPSIPAENILAEEVYQGDPVALEDNIQGLPEGSAVEVVEAITSESAGRFEAKVKVTFKNGSSRMVTVPVIVKERISASVLEEIPSIPAENILVEEVYQGDPVTLEDNIQGLPEGSAVEVVEAITSESAGRFEAKVKVTFKNGSSRMVTVPVIVKERISASVLEEIPSIPAENILAEEVYQGDPVALEDNIQGLPEGSAVEVVEAITSESAGRFEAKVKVTFKNGSSRMVTVPVIVKERISASVLEEIPSIPAENILAEEVYQGDPVALEDNIQGLPEGSAVEVVEAITSESAGRFEAKVKVTFKNGSSRMVTVPVIVKERISASVLEEIPSIPAENILAEEVYQGDPVALEDNIQGLPEGSAVEVVEAITSESAGRFEAKVKVTFKNGSSRMVTVPVIVKERISASVLEEIPSIPAENILAEEVYQGDPVALEDNIQGLPEGSAVEVVEAITSESAGRFEAKVKVTFKNGSSRMVTVPVIVKERISASVLEEIPSIPAENILAEEVYQGDPVALEDNIQGLPEGSAVEVVEAITSESAGRFEAKVKVTFKNGSSRMVTVPVIVKERISASVLEEIPSIPAENILVEEVYQGDPVTLEDNIQGLPEGSAVEVVEAITSESAGRFEAKVKVTFKNGSSRMVTVPVIVKERISASVLEEIPSIPAENILAEEVYQGDPVALEDNIQGLPEGSAVEVVEAITSESAGRFEAKVKVTFKNGSSRMVTVPVIVKERISASVLEEIPSIPAENILAEEVYQGDPVALEDNIQGLPEGSAVEVVEAITSESAGRFEAKVKVTFKNGSSRMVTVPVIVKERISASVLEEIPSIPAENILAEEVYQGDPVALEDNIQGLPEGSAVEVVEAITSESAGRFEAKVKVTFKNGSSRMVTVPVIVKERISASVLEEIPSIPAENILAEEVYQGDPVALEDNIQGLPEGSAVEVVEAITSESAGRFEAKVKVTFKNGSSRMVTVPVIVKERISASVLEEIPSIPAENILVEEVYQGDPVTLEDNIQGLPEGSAVEVVEAITSESAGRFEAKVKVTFKNGSSRMVTVPVIVKERISASVLEEIPSIPAENILAEEVYQGDPVALEDNIQGLPEGSAVEVVEAITSESAGRFEAKVKVTFKNGSSRMVTVPVIVKERISASVLEEIPSIPAENILAERMNQKEPTDKKKEIPSDKTTEERFHGEPKYEKNLAMLGDERKLPETGDVSNLFSLLEGIFLSCIAGILLKWNHRKKMYED